VDDYRAILRHVGWVLIVVGILDICNMAYHLANRSSYMSAFSIVAIAAGGFLIGGNLRAARFVTYYAAFLLTGALGILLLIGIPSLVAQWPALMEFRLIPIGPITSIISFLVNLGVLALLYWIYRRLRAPAVVQAQLAAGEAAALPFTASDAATPPKAAFIAAGVLTAMFAAFWYFISSEAGSAFWRTHGGQPPVVYREPGQLLWPIR
jgi:hypothetical protein